MLTSGDITIQMSAGPRSQLEVITGENDPEKSQRRGGIIRLTVDAPSAHAVGEPRPPRWRSYEFFLYYFVFIVAFPLMVYIPIEVSSSACLSALENCFQPRRRCSFIFLSETLPNYALYRHRLAKGWFPGSEVVSLASWFARCSCRSSPFSPRLDIYVVLLCHCHARCTFLFRSSRNKCLGFQIFLEHLFRSPYTHTRYHRTTAMHSTAPFAQTSRPLPRSWQPFLPSNMPTRALSSAAHLLRPITYIASRFILSSRY